MVINIIYENEFSPIDNSLVSKVIGSVNVSS